MKRAGATFLALTVCFTALPAFARTAGLSAKSAIVVDASNGGVLYAKNPHLRLPPASTAKLMTALVALERLPFDRRVRVSARAAAAPNSKAGLTPGATYRVKDLAVENAVIAGSDGRRPGLVKGKTGWTFASRQKVR